MCKLIAFLILFTASASAFPSPVPHPWRVTLGGGWNSYRMSDLNTKQFDIMRSDLPDNPRNLGDGSNFFFAGLS